MDSPDTAPPSPPSSSRRLFEPCALHKCSWYEECTCVCNNCELLPTCFACRVTTLAWVLIIVSVISACAFCALGAAGVYLVVRRRAAGQAGDAMYHALGTESFGDESGLDAPSVGDHSSFSDSPDREDIDDEGE